MTQHRGFETPDCMVGRPVDHRGFPVPWFVTRHDADGRWDFAAVDTTRAAEALRKKVCWVSGTPLGRRVSFVIGPMCIVNRVSGDPPVRNEVALWSVKICPFLSRPQALRDKRFRSDDVLEGQRGLALARNPGVSAIYVTRSFDPYRGVLRLGEPESVSWWAEGREATAAEVWASIDSGLPRLLAEAEKDGSAAVADLGKYLARAMPLFPARPQAEVA